MPAQETVMIQSKRVHLRFMQESDLPALFEVEGHPQVARYLPNPPWSNVEDAQRWYKFRADMQSAGKLCQFVMVDNSSGTPIGSCVLFNFDYNCGGQIELGYALAPAYWGGGYMKEALTALIDDVFKRSSIQRLEAQVDLRNGASERLLLALGFVKEGITRQRYITQGERTDAGLYGLLRDDWSAAVR
ncbi:MAG: hypothetical protein RL341_800 [Pseudomonadota bacterium]|jgi:RimJ/RimL family protein N-acetyltransferase